MLVHGRHPRTVLLALLFLAVVLATACSSDSAAVDVSSNGDASPEGAGQPDEAPATGEPERITFDRSEPSMVKLDDVDSDRRMASYAVQAVAQYVAPGALVEGGLKVGRAQPSDGLLKRLADANAMEFESPEFKEAAFRIAVFDLTNGYLVPPRVRHGVEVEPMKDVVLLILADPASAVEHRGMYSAATLEKILGSDVSFAATYSAAVR